MFNDLSGRAILVFNYTIRIHLFTVSKFHGKITDFP